MTMNNDYIKTRGHNFNTGYEKGCVVQMRHTFGTSEIVFQKIFKRFLVNFQSSLIYAI